MVKPGYKQTEIGVIPENWIVRRLSECTKRVGVGLATSVTQYYREDGVPIFRNLNIKPGYLDDSDILYLDPDFANRQESKKIRTGDVLTVHTGYVGISCVVPAKYNNALTFTTLITTTDSNLLLPEFLSIYLNSSFGALEIESLQAGGGRNNLNVNDFVNFRIPLPSIDEQYKIVEYLKEIDRYLELTNQQLAKKKAIKQGAMQELLTGKKRLLGFASEWQTFIFGELFDFIPNNAFTRAQMSDNGKVKNIHYGDILTKYGEYVDGNSNAIPYISREVDLSRFADRCYLQSGDIIIADTAEDEAVGKALEVVNVNCPILAGQHTLMCRPKIKFADKFLGYYLNAACYHDQLLPYIVGTKVSSVSKASVAQTKLVVPEYEEQQAIAEILSNMDSEIEALEQKLAKYRQIKQGMMQQLLTGKIRLV